MQNLLTIMFDHGRLARVPAQLLFGHLCRFVFSVQISFQYHSTVLDSDRNAC